jgi:pyruvate, water dikinase
MKYIVDLNTVNISNIDIVGGKNASTGEMHQHLSSLGIKINGGFATTVEAYKKFIKQNDLDKKISKLLSTLKTADIKTLNKTSAQIRRWIMATPLYPEFEKEIATVYKQFNNAAVAVRSSATAENLPSASFAGQQESYINIKGLKNVLTAVKLVFASLFTSRAIAYRHHHGFDHEKFAISVGIQPMVRSDKGASGVIFTLDTESGFDQVILITGSYGLGEAIVQGQVNPDEFIVYKPALETEKNPILQRRLGEKAIKVIYTNNKNPGKSTKIISVKESERLRFCIDDEDIQTLAHHALLIEKHYRKPMDIKWAKDGLNGEI